MQTVKLNNGVEMPILGFGVYQITDMDECEKVVSEALNAGYRSIDTASAYFNEEAVGCAIKKSGIPREELFITTKLWIQDAGYENAKKAFQKSLDNLGLEYLDLYLIHQPFNDYYGSWRAMEELYKAGKIRAIGVSNFEEDRLVDLILNNEITPAINQVETHPFFQQKRGMEVMKEYNVQIESWGPFSQGGKDIFNNKTLISIAKKHNKTVAQVILRWHIQRDVVVIPKSVKTERMKENFNVFDFALDDIDMESISKLDLEHSEIIDYHTEEWTVMLNNLKIHD